MAAFDDLVKMARGMDVPQLELLLAVGRALLSPIEQWVGGDSDLMGNRFGDHFANRLRIYHATHVEKLNKKAFEYAFAAASVLAGRKAVVTEDSTTAGADVVVDGIPFSLKTEASSGIDRAAITISKLMEARWIRECETGEDFARETTSRVTAHLSRYRRILMLRAFDETELAFRYELLEIPVEVLLALRTLTAADFSPRTKNGSSRASVRVAGKQAFLLRLDGSVEKVTVSGLDVRLCRPHAWWVIPKTLPL